MIWFCSIVGHLRNGGRMWYFGQRQLTMVKYSQNRNFGRVQPRTDFWRSEIEKPRFRVVLAIQVQSINCYVLILQICLRPCRLRKHKLLQQVYTWIYGRKRFATYTWLLFGKFKELSTIVLHGCTRGYKVVQQDRKSKITREMEEVGGSHMLSLMTLKLQRIVPISWRQNCCIHRRNGLFHLGWVRYHGIAFLYQTLPQKHEMELKNCTYNSYFYFWHFWWF